MQRGRIYHEVVSVRKLCAHPLPWMLAGLLVVGAVLGAVAAALRFRTAVASMQPASHAAQDASEGPAQGQPAVAAPAPSVQEAEVEVPQRLLWPISGRLIRAFGWQYSGTFRDWRWHPGVDIAAPVGTPVRCAAAGRTVAVGTSWEMGLWLKVEHGGGLETVYAHLGSVRVGVGDRVAAGDQVGTVGEPGPGECADGPHLHFEVLIDGKAVDPMAWME